MSDQYTYALILALRATGQSCWLCNGTYRGPDTGSWMIARP